jgi:hypothetical protein
MASVAFKTSLTWSTSTGTTAIKIITIIREVTVTQLRRRLFFPLVIIVLFGLAAVGVWQVYLTSGGAEPSSEPQSPTEAQAAQATPDEHNRQVIAEFVNSGSDPCTLPMGGIDGDVDWALPYADLPSLINDVDLVVLGRPTTNTAEQAESHTLAGRMLTTIAVDQVLLGPETQTVTADLIGRVMNSDTGLVHIANIDLDSCSQDQLLLFLNETVQSGTYAIVGYQGWVKLESGEVEPGELNRLFDGQEDASELVHYVQEILQQQADAGLPKGRLLCQSRQQRDEGLSPVACPGDVFNPYESFYLAQPVAEAYVVVSDPGPSPLTLSRTELAPDSSQLTTLLEALDSQVALQPLAAEPQDLIRISLLVQEAPQDRAPPVFQYSPSTGVVRISASNGQFDAPPAFVEAMAPFVAQQQEAADQ